MFMEKHETGFRLMSEAVQAWYRFYAESPENHASQVLCNAAIDLYHDGYLTVDAIAASLIGTYVGICSTKVNAPTSASIH